MDSQPANATQARIIVVNDDVTQLGIFVGLLAKHGYATEGFSEVTPALERMEAAGPPDLIITDLYMPVIDGWRFCRLLRSPEYAALNQTPILVNSATFSGRDAEKITAELGANAFLPSPVRGADLLRRVQQLLARRPPLPLPGVLIVEDDPDIASVLENIFRIHGYHADAVASGREAREKFAATPYDLIVIDYHLPDILGDSLLREFHGRRADAVYIMTTGDMQPRLAVEWMKLGASAYVHKPFDADYLYAVSENARRERALLRIPALLEDRTRELRKSEELLKLAMRTARMGYWRFDCQSRQLTWSGGEKVMFGVPLDEVSGSLEQVQRQIHPGDRQAGLEALRRAIEDGQPFDYTCRVVRPGGEVCWLHSFGSLNRDAKGEPDHIFGVTQDITGRKRREALTAARLRLLELADTATLEDFLRATLDEAETLSGSAISFFHFLEEDQATLSLQVWSAQTVRDACSAEGAGLHYPVSDAGVWVDCVRERRSVIHNDYAALKHRRGFPPGHVALVREMTVPVMRGNKIAAVLGVGNKALDYDGADRATLEALADLAWDIASRKRAEEAQRRLQEQLAQAQKMDSIGRLAGGVAHDFNNMLGVILGHVELALTVVDPRAQLHDHLVEIQKAAVRSADLTRQLLAFARRQTVSPRVIDLNETVSGMLKMLQRLIGENIDLDWLPGGGLWPVKIDPAQVDQLLANLCVNARDAIRDVGRITIETGNAVLDEADCTPYADALPGRYVMLAVRDNGCGMAPEVRNQIFEPFFTTKGPGAGTGLGLATVYGVVRQNGGFITLESEPGAGSTFRIYLAPHEGAVAPAQTGVPVEEALLGDETILLVEDEAAILSLGEMVLKHLGYTVLAATTPGDALRMAEDHAGRIDLIVTDVVMPEMNGRELATRLEPLYPHLKCLFMSGYTADIIAHHGLLDEGVNFIQKPFTMQLLSARVREVLDLKQQSRE